HDFERRKVAAFGGPIRRRKRESVLNIGHVLLVDGELPALLVVTNENRGRERCLYAEQVVEIRLVRSHDDVELRILKIHPVEIAGIVVIAEKRVGSKLQELGEGWIIT